MATHVCTVTWTRNGAAFTDQRYSRAHRWTFDGGTEVPASSSPHVVPIPLSNAAAVDPEEAFVASLSSCHMLWFLSIAAKRGFVVDSYTDEAVGILSKDTNGRLVMTRVTLRPRVDFATDQSPSMNDLREMHHEAHELCYIANSVRSEVVCEPVWVSPSSR